MTLSDGLRAVEEHLQLSDEDRKQSAIDAMWKATREACKQITINRRSAELTLGISREKYDEELNKMCAEFNEEYGNMTEDQLTKAMLREILERLI